MWTRRERLVGAMLGLAVGDALGVTNEFDVLPEQPWTPLLDGPHRDVVGGGAFGLGAGQTSDDTHMACALAGSLMTLGRYDTPHAFGRYRAWLDMGPPDVGSLTRRVLSSIHAYPTPFEAARRDWETGGKNNAPNGSLMRTAPIGVFFWKDAGARRSASLDDSASTHYDPRCQLACAAYNAALAAASEGAQEPFQMLAAAREELAAATEQAIAEHFHGEERLVRGAAGALQRDLKAAGARDPHLYGRDVHLAGMQGFVRVAFRLAFWELLHADSFEEGLLDVVNRGGDTDTNGAIAGALLGAFHGEGSIPQRWKGPVLAARPSVGRNGGDPAYHPRVLTALAEGVAAESDSA